VLYAGGNLKEFKEEQVDDTDASSLVDRPKQRDFVNI
jgi:hypothetical protein